MKKPASFYSTVIGRVMAGFVIGGLVGYLIYLWRGAERAPYICAVASAFYEYLRTKNILKRPGQQAGKS